MWAGPLLCDADRQFAQAEVEHIHTTGWSALHPCWIPGCIFVLENAISDIFPVYLRLK